MKDYRNIIFALVVAVFVLQMLVMRGDAKSEEKVLKPIVVLSTFSLYDIAKHIAADSFDLVMLLPVGVDAHSYEPTPKMMEKLNKSPLVIYSGAGLESWTKNLELKNRVVDMSKYIQLRELESNEYHIHEHHDKQCTHEKIDPHYWLNIDNMRRATDIITQEFIDLEYSSKEKFLKNRDSYLAMLNRLDKIYKEELSSCYLDTMIVNHNAFSYLSHKYGFNLKSLSGFSPNKKVAPKDIIRISNEIKMHKVSTVFYEDFASNETIKSLAQEAKVEVDTLQPLANITKEDLEKNYTYEDIMENNLIKISKALICK
ncbi:metal ABC transporter substrate-binding protein [Sulfurimonas sp.]